MPEWKSETINRIWDEHGIPVAEDRVVTPFQVPATEPQPPPDPVPVPDPSAEGRILYQDILVGPPNTPVTVFCEGVDHNANVLVNGVAMQTETGLLFHSWHPEYRNALGGYSRQFFTIRMPVSGRITVEGAHGYADFMLDEHMTMNESPGSVLRLRDGELLVAPDGRYETVTNRTHDAIININRRKQCGVIAAPGAEVEIIIPPGGAIATGTGLVEDLVFSGLKGVGELSGEGFGFWRQGERRNIRLVNCHVTGTDAYGELSQLNRTVGAYVLGNYVHDCGASDSDIFHGIYHGGGAMHDGAEPEERVYFPNDHVYMRYNRIERMGGNRSCGIQIYGHWLHERLKRFGIGSNRVEDCDRNGILLSLSDSVRGADPTREGEDWIKGPGYVNNNYVRRGGRDGAIRFRTPGLEGLELFENDCGTEDIRVDHIVSGQHAGNIGNLIGADAHKLTEI